MRPLVDQTSNFHSGSARITEYFLSGSAATRPESLFPLRSALALFGVPLGFRSLDHVAPTGGAKGGSNERDILRDGFLEGAPWQRCRLAGLVREEFLSIPSLS